MPEQDIYGSPAIWGSDDTARGEDSFFLNDFFNGVTDFTGDLFSGGSGSNTWSNLISQLFTPKGVIGGIGTIFDYLNAGDREDALGEFAQRFDPYETQTPNRGPMQQQLAQMMLNPNFDATQIPGWGGMMGAANIAAETAMRKMAQRGNFYSGGAPGILAKTYADHFIPFMENYRGDLLQTSGANFNPNTGVGLEALLASMAAGHGGTSGIFDFLGKLLGGGQGQGGGAGGIEGLLSSLLPGLLSGEGIEGIFGSEAFQALPEGVRLGLSQLYQQINPGAVPGIPGNIGTQLGGAGPAVPPSGGGGGGLPPTPPAGPISNLANPGTTAPGYQPGSGAPVNNFAGSGAATGTGGTTSAIPGAPGSVKGPAVTNYGNAPAQTGLNAGGAVSSIGGALSSTGGALTGGIAAEGAYAGLPAAYAPGAGAFSAIAPFAIPLGILGLSQIGAGPYHTLQGAQKRINEGTVQTVGRENSGRTGDNQPRTLGWSDKTVHSALGDWVGFARDDPERAWSGLSQEGKQRLWKLMGQEGEVPDRIRLTSASGRVQRVPGSGKQGEEEFYSTLTWQDPSTGQTYSGNNRPPPLSIQRQQANESILNRYREAKTPSNRRAALHAGVIPGRVPGEGSH